MAFVVASVDLPLSTFVTGGVLYGNAVDLVLEFLLCVNVVDSGIRFLWCSEETQSDVTRAFQAIEKVAAAVLLRPACVAISFPFGSRKKPNEKRPRVRLWQQGAI